VRRDVPVPVAPFWGARVLSQIRLSDVLACLDRNALYRLQWGARNAKGDEWQELQHTFDQLLRELIHDAERDGWLVPQVAYGYYPAQADGNAVLVYDPNSVTGNGHMNGSPLARFVFPRQPERERLCLADYFRPVESGERDVIAFQLVTMGRRADDLVDQLQAAGNYSRAYYIHGLSVALTEGLAEYTNRLIRKGLGLAVEQGKRYSWGYPACPDLDQHDLLFQILPHAQIGVALTEAWQLIPEQSTAALVVHHPQAVYFSIGSVRERAEDDVASLELR